ncbi:hypothetical protein BJ912DRAFT_998736, partial [Pholiota molesta]
FLCARLSFLGAAAALFLFFHISSLPPIKKISAFYECSYFLLASYLSECLPLAFFLSSSPASSASFLLASSIFHLPPRLPLSAFVLPSSSAHVIVHRPSVSRTAPALRIPISFGWG